MAVRSEASVCVRPLAWIVGWNPAGDMNVCVLLGRGLCDGPIPRPGESHSVCQCKKERKRERKKERSDNEWRRMPGKKEKKKNVKHGGQIQDERANVKDE